MRKIKYASGLFLVVTFTLASLLTPAGIILSDSAYNEFDTLSQINTEEILQFSSGGHILGFASDAVYLAGLDHALKLEFINGNNKVFPRQLESAGEAESGLPELGKVVYNSIWANIDVIFSAATDGIAESTYIIHPGGDDADIALRYNVPVEITPSGGLKLIFPSGYMTETPPIAWQDFDGRRVPVEVQFNLNASNEVGFKLGHYDSNHAVYVDPVYQWHTFYGNTGPIHGVDIFGNPSDISFSADGSIYIAATEQYTWNGPGNQTPLNIPSGSCDIYYKTTIVIVKLNSAGIYQWHTFYGGCGEEARGIEVDAEGYVYVTATRGVMPLNGPGNQAPLNDFGSFLVIKLSSSGEYQWHTYTGDEYITGISDYGQVTGITVANDGSIYLTGLNYRPWNGPGNQAPINDFYDYGSYVVIKLNSEGVYQWHTFYGATYNCKSRIAMATDGSIYLTGKSNPTHIGLVNQEPLNTCYDPDDELSCSVMIKLSSDGVHQWHTFFGGLSEDIAVATDGSIYVIGHSRGSSFNGPDNQAPLNAAHPGSNENSYNNYIIKLSSDGVYQWHTFFGSPKYTFYQGITIGEDGSVYGASNSSESWNGPDNQLPRYAYNDSDRFGNYYRFNIEVIKLNNTGVYQWHTFYGSYTYAVGIAAAKDGSIYVHGYSHESFNGPGNKAPINEHSGGEGFVIIKMSQAEPDNQVNANLSSLTVSQGSLTPAFSPATTSYSVSVPQITKSINIAATLSDAGASMTINGVLTASGVARAVSLNAAGTTTPVSVVVTAADGVTVKTYSVSILRAGGSSNPSPLFIFYENGSGEIVLVDYQKMIDDLFNGDTRFRSEVRIKLSEALSGLKAIYVQDSLRTIDCDKAFNAGKTYIEAYPDSTYWVASPVPLKELILNYSTGKGEEVVIID